MLAQIMTAGSVRNELTGACLVYGFPIITRGHICVRKDLINKQLSGER